MEGINKSNMKAKILYFCKENYFNLMLSACKESIVQFKHDISFHLYHALALFLCDRISESLTELESMHSENDVRNASLMASYYINKRVDAVNRDLLHHLEKEIIDYKKVASGSDLYNTSFALFILKDYQKALDFVDKSLNLEPNVTDTLLLKGWIIVHLNMKLGEEIEEIFELALEEGQKHLFGYLGLSMFHKRQENYEEAINVINRAIVHFPNLTLPLVEKMRLQFSLKDWEQTIETMNRVIIEDARNLTALKYNILLLLCRDSNYEEAAKCIKNYVNEIDHVEPKNTKILLESAQLFSRICGRNVLILQETYSMVEKAVQINSNSADCLNELGHQNFLQGKIKDALKMYKLSTKLNNSSSNALMGLTLCELTQNGKTEQIRQQVEFLLQLQESVDNPMVLLMQAKLANNAEEAVNFLNKTCNLHFEAVKSYPYGDDYLRLLNPDFLMDVVKEYLNYITYTSDLTNKNRLLQTPNSSLDNSLKLLNVIVTACPGIQDAVFLLAKVLYLKGELNEAMKHLEHILSNADSTSSDAHLLMSQILLQNGSYERASQNLEVALSHNFKIRENPLYHFIIGLVEKKSDRLLDASKSLTTALSLVNVKTSKTSPKKLSMDSNSEITLAEKASIYVELIDVHLKMQQAVEAEKLLQFAMNEFKGTPEESRITILNADHAVSRNNVKSAIDMLRKVTSNESYYLQAKTKLAHIFLKYRNDRKAYLQCYEEMVELNPGPESFVLLGDAYLNILEVEEALEAYNRALQMNPKDPYLTSKMGKALVETHYFNRAINYYKDTIKLTDDPELKLQLADLYTQLKQYDKAEMLLISEVESEKNKKIDDLNSLRYKLNLYKTLSGIQEKLGNFSVALSTLKEARDIHSRIRKRISLEQSVVPYDESKEAVGISLKLAELSINIKDNEQAVHHYKDALVILPNDFDALAALAKLYMQMNYLELCQQTCAVLLELNPDNETASLMMADIAFRKVDFQTALFHYTQFINKQPTNWTALVRFIEVTRRTGNLDDVPQYLQQAESHTINTSRDPGFSYCTALYERYSGNLNSALRNFNIARQDPEWGKQAICNMIEICLNPEDEMLGDQFIDQDDSEYKDSRSMALKTAERLLKELKQKIDSTPQDILKYKLLSNFLTLSTKEKYDIERALEEFIQLASQDVYKDCIGPILGIATAYTMLKQGQRAKNQLKRIMKSVWTFDDAEYLERCWLLLADCYMQASKYETALDLLKRVLQYNKACSKAYEYSGFISEKEQHYKEAAKFYDCAWRHSGKTNPTIGFKLAYCYMKSKRHAEAIDMCQQVLKLNPEYPRVKKDILDKCMNNLRT